MAPARIPVSNLDRFSELGCLPVITLMSDKATRVDQAM